MSFKVGLVNGVDAVFTAHLVKSRIVRIVRCSHRVAVRFFNKENITLHILDGDIVTRERVAVVTVYSSENFAFAVDKELLVLYLNLFNAEPERNNLTCMEYKQGVKIRLFGIPQNRIGKLNNRVVIKRA